METLTWNEFLGNSSVASAYGDLLGMTERSVTLHPSGHSKSFWTAWRDAILVFAYVPSPTIHHAIVHELIHALLMEEGYYRPTWGEEGQMRAALSNDLQHPEVFRRMEEYGLDMVPYWAYWEPELRSGLARLKGKDANQLAYHFLQIFTWFFFPNASGRYLEEYRRFNPVLYEAAHAAHDEAQQIGCSTADRHKRFLAVFTRHWRLYCTEHLPHDDLGQRDRHLLEGSQLECVRDKVNARTEQFVMNYLKQAGLS